MHHGALSKGIAKGLRVLRERIDAAEIPSSKLDETLNIATWNVRELGRKPRRKASLHYIAEVIGQFDLVSIVELRDDVSELAEVLGYLGPYWKVVYSDYLTDAGGNRERIAYVFDERAAVFTGLASNAVPPRRKSHDEYLSAISWWRPPYMASFRAGSFDFVMLTAHVRWGKTEKGRIPELRELAAWVDKRVKDPAGGERDIIVAGDFNIPSDDSPLMAALCSKGLQLAPGLQGKHGSNLAKDKRYDQILHDPRFVKSFTAHGGVLDFYQGDHASLYPGEKLTKQQFTYELSDHLPLWIQVNTDTEAERLDQLIGGHS